MALDGIDSFRALELGEERVAAIEIEKRCENGVHYRSKTITDSGRLPGSRNAVLRQPT